MNVAYASHSFNKPTPLAKVVVKEHQREQVVTYTREDDGTVKSSDNALKDEPWLRSAKRKLVESLVPENISQNVSKDYIPTRKWEVAREVFGSFAGTAAGAALIAAVAGANSAIVALGIAGVTLANINWVKDRLAQMTGFAMGASGIAKFAEKNPRPWIMAADTVNAAATVVDSTAAFMPPLSYYPMLATIGVVRSVVGAAAGAAAAGIAPRQAIADNIGEVGAKNGNQSTLATLVGSTASLAALGALTAAIGFAPAATAIAVAGSAAGLFCKYKMLQNLDYNPVNETALRKVISNQDDGTEISGPERNLFKLLPSIFRSDKLTVGASIAPLLNDANFPALRELYSERPFIVSVQDGKPHIVLKDDLESDKDTPKKATLPLPDGEQYARKTAEVQAAYQAIRLEQVLAGDDYASRLETQGKDQANLWAAQESYKQTPEDIRPLLLEMREVGWSVDTVRFFGEARPAEIGVTPTTAAVPAALAQAV